MSDFFALVTIMIWPVIPLFWIPVHGAPGIFRKIGLLSYVVPLVTWLPLAYFILLNRDFILSHKVSLPAFLKITGLILLVSGTILQVWTARLLSFRGITGMPEISSDEKGTFVAAGAFSAIRHPTYLSHTLMLTGIFLFTEITAVGIVALLDFVLIHTVVIPLEEKELAERFGEQYRNYKKEVPAFFPRIRLK